MILVVGMLLAGGATATVSTVDAGVARPVHGTTANPVRHLPSAQVATLGISVPMAQ